MNFLFRLLVVCLIASGSSVIAEGFKSTKVPRFDTAVHKAVAFLNGAEVPEKEVTLVAYALLKAGEPTTASHVADGIKDALARATSSNGYQGYDHIYLAGIDAMLLADADADAHAAALGRIGNYVMSSQKTDGAWSDSLRNPGDTSMTQYALLALWAARRADAEINGQTIEKAVGWYLKNGSADGGWAYRPGTDVGDGRGASTHPMTMAGAGSAAIARTVLFGPRTPPENNEAPGKYAGILKKVKTDEISAGGIPGYRPSVSAGAIDKRVDKAFQWNEVRFEPVCRSLNKMYFYYALERAAALAEVETIKGRPWFQSYGDGLLTLQKADGSFESKETATSATAFAILYYMRSTKQILDKQYGTGIQAGGRGLIGLFGGKEKKKKELGPLDELLGALENADLSKLDNMEEIVEKVEFGSREELIGQVDKLKKLLESNDAAHRQTAYYALGRTGDFALLPLMLKGLRDPNLAVNTEALQALRYIARKPNGFGMPTDPLSGGAFSSEEQKLVRANNWRTETSKKWRDWYRRVRPYEEGGGFDELQLLAPGVSR